MSGQDIGIIALLIKRSDFSLAFNITFSLAFLLLNNHIIRPLDLSVPPSMPLIVTFDLLGIGNGN